MSKKRVQWQHLTCPSKLVCPQKAAKDTKTDHELGFCHDPALPKEWARETREKTRKGMRGVGLGADLTSRDPTRGKGRAPARSGVACPKNVQRQHLTCPSKLVCPPSWSDPALPKEWARETREETRKGSEVWAGSRSHIARPDTRQGRAPARSGVACPKNVQRQHLTCPSKLVLGAARLEASSCCFSEHALALSELRLFPIGLTRCSPFSDARCRIAQERVPTNWTCGAAARGSASLVATAKAGAFAYHISDRRSLSRVTGHWPGTTAAPSEP